MDGYWRRLATRLQASDSLAERLLAAQMGGLASRISEDRSAPADQDRAALDSLLGQALQSDDPLVLSLATTIASNSPDKPRLQALASHWSESDPGNLAPLWFAGGPVDQVLADARGRARYDSRAYAHIRLMFNAFLATPTTPRESGVDPALDARNAEADALKQAWGVWAATALPSFAPLVGACKGAALKATPTRAHECLHLGRTMALHSDTVVGKSIGIALLRNSARTPPDAELAARLHRNMEWLLERNFEALRGLGSEDAEVAHALRMLTTPGIDNELEAMRTTLREHDIALEAPANWSKAPHPAGQSAP